MNGATVGIGCGVRAVEGYGVVDGVTRAAGDGCDGRHQAEDHGVQGVDVELSYGGGREETEEGCEESCAEEHVGHGWVEGWFAHSEGLQHVPPARQSSVIIWLCATVVLRQIG